MEQKTHCPYCGGLLTHREVEDRLRLFCPRCNRPIYENPVPATCLVVINPSGQLLLVKRRVPPQQGQWCLPGGFMELDEKPETAALRELYEETGLTGTIDSLLGVRTSISTSYHSVLLIGYLVRKFDGQLTPGDDAEEARWVDHAHLPPIPFESHAHYINHHFKKLPSLLIDSLRVSALKCTPNKK